MESTTHLQLIYKSAEYYTLSWSLKSLINLFPNNYFSLHNNTEFMHLLTLIL